MLQPARLEVEVYQGSHEALRLIWSRKARQEQQLAWHNFKFVFLPCTPGFNLNREFYHILPIGGEYIKNVWITYTASNYIELMLSSP
jgi:hypothetical protein